MNSNETKDNKDQDEKSKFYDTATTILGIAGAVGAVMGLASWLGSSSKEKGPQEKMMKAPGKDGYIHRNHFESNPKDYFKDLRGKK
ncbi:hypothetical protein AALP_AA6G338500 [Arabis alpina]|uniref:Uncharacterized protein n=1 Tax=Arabis alpina TaxID=50452 RepID=A0A087GTG0_ARAAL|nr:hypothetical protein AALP_AA6G338500 [Arabis alpina]